MAKHSHRLLLNQKKTWRCTLPGCGWFIHLGLAHILPGKRSVCNECGDEFTLDEETLKNDMPVCHSCNMTASTGMSMDDLTAYTETRMELGKLGLQSTDDLTPVQRRMIELKGIQIVHIPRALDSQQSDTPTMEEVVDEIEVYNPDENGDS